MASYVLPYFQVNGFIFHRDEPIKNETAWDENNVVIYYCSIFGNIVNSNYSNQYHSDVKKYVEDIQENNTRIKVNTLKNFTQAVQNILLTTGMDQHPEQILECMTEQQRDELNLDIQVTTSQDTCRMISANTDKLINDKFAGINEYVEQEINNFEVTLETADNMKHVLQNQVLESVATFQIKVKEMFKNMGNLVDDMKNKIDTCLGNSEKLCQQYFEEYTEKFRKCIENILHSD